MTCLDCRPGRPCAECAARGNAAPAANVSSGMHAYRLRMLGYQPDGRTAQWQQPNEYGQNALARRTPFIGETLVADIIEALSVRAGEVLTKDVIEERSRNIAAALLGKYEIKERT